MTDRLRELDNKVLGRSVPDERPRSQQLLRPRPAVWSRNGRLLYGALVLAVFAVLSWVSDPAVSVSIVVALAPIGFLIVAAEERKRSRKFYGGEK